MSKDEKNNEIKNIKPMQETIKTTEFRWIIHGAKMLAKELLEECESKQPLEISLNKAHNREIFLKELLKSKYNMATYIYGGKDNIIYILEQPKGRKKQQIKGIKVKYKGSHFQKPNVLEPISEEEHKYRLLSNYLLDVVEDSARLISILTNADMKEVKQKLLNKKEIKKLRDGGEIND